MNKPLKLFVFEGVLTDRTDGLAFALAPTIEEARRLICKEIGYISEDIMNYEPSVHKVTEPVAYYIYGGG